MSERHPSADKAAQYLLGDMSDAERREFEAELANSAELRALLRELEESSVLLAMSSPRRRPPAKVWQSIEKTISAERQTEEPVPAFWATRAWLGWAAAAAIVFSWLLYSFWTNRPTPSDFSKGTEVPSAVSPGDTSRDLHAAGDNHDNSPRNKTAPASPLLSADSQELLRLRRQVTELQNRVTNLSQTVAQQHALLGESNRIKFFQVVSSSGTANPAVTPALSPALQRALFIAMARELGWVSPTDASYPGTNSAFPPGGNIDFVDLRPATNGPPKIVPPPPNSQVSNHTTSDSSPAPNSAPIAIPAFTSGNNVVVAIDQSIVPGGTQVSFLNQEQQTIGWATIWDNPMVFTVPVSAGGTVFITTSGGGGVPLNLFQFSNPGSPSP